MDEKFWTLKRVREGGDEHLDSVAHKKAYPMHKVFGASSLKEWERAAGQKTAGDGFTPDFRRLDMERKQVVLFYEKGSPEQKKEVENLALEALTDPKALLELQKISGQSVSDVESVIDSLRKDDIPREFFVRILKSHKEHYDKKNQEVSELGERLKVDFLTQVQKGVQDGFLDPETDLKKVEQRLQNTTFFYIDPVSGGSSASVSRSEEGSIGIADDHLTQKGELTRHVIFHELVHASLAGLQIVAAVGTDSGNVMSHHNRKDGLRFDFERGARGEKIGWMMGLNEGVTEYIARRLSGVSETGAYGFQITYMEVMNKNGVKMSEFIHAYQEDYALGEKGVQRLPKLAKLLGSIREHMGENWYNKQVRPLKLDFGFGL